VRDYLTELRIGEKSPLVGQTLVETDMGENYGLNVLYVSKNGSSISALDSYRMNQGDVLLLEGAAQNIVNARRQYKLQDVDDWTAAQWRPEGETDGFHLAEVILAPNSRYENRSLKDIGFRKQYGLSVLALRHNGKDEVSSLGDFPLQLGDSLLVQGAIENFDQLLNDPNLVALESPNIELRRTHKAPIAMFILLSVVVGAASGLFPIAPLMLAGAMAMVVAQVISMEEAYRAIDWKAVFLIAGMLPLGIAMESTGTAQLLADQLVLWTGGWGTLAVLACVFIMTALLTEVISNAAAAVLMVPIAMDVALSLNANVQPFVMATVLAASTSFLTPVGHQVNVLVFGAGGYKFSDYSRLGVGLNLLMLLLVVTVLPLIWPLY
jgi:di/tricarboxylate transporter